MTRALAIALISVSVAGLAFGAAIVVLSSLDFDGWNRKL